MARIVKTRLHDSETELHFAEKQKRRNPLLWLFEPLESEPGFYVKKLFGCDAAVLDDRLYLAVTNRNEPWSGLIVATSRDHHASLLSKFPSLSSHPIVGKWLYLSQSRSDFEDTATSLVSLALSRDARLGVPIQVRSRQKSNLS